MYSVKITPGDLNGVVDIPASKSLCHRAIIAAGLSNNECLISNIVFSEDIYATCGGMMDLGVDIKAIVNGAESAPLELGGKWKNSNKNKGNNIGEKIDSLLVKGNNLLNSVKYEIDCNESGSTLRFLIPIVLLTAEKVTLHGSEKLSERPLTPYYKIFDEHKVKYDNKNGLPLTLQGMLKPGIYEVPGNISSQFISGLLFALPLLYEDSKIVITTELQSKGYVDLTIDILAQFGVLVENIEYRQFIIKGNQKYKAIDYRVEGDFSQGAFWIVAGILGGNIKCNDLRMNSLQGDKVIVDIVRKMGGNITLDNDKILAVESKTMGTVLDVSEYPDLVPILAVLAAVSVGTTEIINASRLRIKESDRLKAMATELNKLGADVVEMEDGLIIHGKERLKGGKVDSWNDHRIAMALTIASIKCDEEVIISNSCAINKSYPHFYNDFKSLGGKIDEWNMGEEN